MFILFINFLSQSHERVHAIFFDMAMDILPIQASSVPSERVFSSSAQTDTVRRNRVKPILMEALQMLKFGMSFCCFGFCC
jgi:hypothetical protein